MTMPDRREFNYGGLVAVILASALALVLIAAVAANLIFDHQLSEGAADLVKTIAVGLVGALGVWLGHGLKKNGT